MDAPPRKFSFKRATGLQSGAEEDEVVVKRFNVFLVDDYEKELRLRTYLFENGSAEKGKEPQRDVILISSLGMWAIEVGICRCHYRWTLTGDSWEDFTRHHLLRTGDVIWFEIVGDMVWRAHVIDSFSCCEKVLTMPAEDPSARAPPAKKKKKKGKDEEEADQFTAEITELHTRVNYLNLPRSFLKHCAWVQILTRAILVDSQGNAWEMGIYIPGAKQGDYRYVQFRGWHAFTKAHDLKVGDSCAFKLDPDSHLATSSSFVMKVRITK